MTRDGGLFITAGSIRPPGPQPGHRPRAAHPPRLHRLHQLRPLQPRPRRRRGGQCSRSHRHPHLQVNAVLHQPVPPQPQHRRPAGADRVLPQRHDRDVHETGKKFREPSKSRKIIKYPEHCIKDIRPIMIIL